MNIKPVYLYTLYWCVVCLCTADNTDNIKFIRKQVSHLLKLGHC